jgi:hypothetical protein
MTALLFTVIISHHLSPLHAVRMDSTTQAKFDSLIFRPEMVQHMDYAEVDYISIARHATLLHLPEDGDDLAIVVQKTQKLVSLIEEGKYLWTHTDQTAFSHFKERNV